MILAGTIMAAIPQIRNRRREKKEIEQNHYKRGNHKYQKWWEERNLTWSRVLENSVGRDKVASFWGSRYKYVWCF